MTGLAQRLGKQLAALNPPGLPGWAADLRARGAGDYRRNGLPTVRVEDWKYTSLRRLEDQIDSLGTADGEDPTECATALVEGSIRINLRQGEMQALGQALPPGVEILSLGEVLAQPVPDPALRTLLESLTHDAPGDAVAAINTATLEHGVIIRVAPGTQAGRILLDWRGQSSTAGWFNARVCVLLGEGASLEWIDHFEMNDEGLMNLVFQVQLDQGSTLEHVRLQDNGAANHLLTRTEITQGQNSVCRQTYVDLGGALTRHDTQLRLADESAQCSINGAYLPTGEAHVDHHLSIDHVAMNCLSDQFFRGVLRDQSRAVFNGRVHVLPGADGTEAHQSNANLLLSGDAEIDTKPELVIEADEVVASHGATVGQLDETAVFYLRSRGLDEDAARALLTGAFCQAVIDRIDSEEIRTALASRLASHLEVES